MVLGAGAVTVGATVASAAEPVFAHGVASGDPLPDAVLLWTRVTPTPDATPGSGVGPTVDVTWEVATDAAFAAVVASGVVSTGPGRDHTVKVDATGLAPATTYYYRFRLGGAVSAAGTTRTAPALSAAVARLRFGVVSCSNVPAGYFAAYRYLAERGDLDAVLHLGDYVYEYAGDFNGADVRPHDPPREILTLADYRRRHAQYKSDEHLQRLHATRPVHRDLGRPRGRQRRVVRRRREPPARTPRVPTRLGRRPPTRRTSSGCRYATRPTSIYRRLRFGLLAELFMLDLRSYRSQQVGIGDGGTDDPNRTITGAEQMAWLENGLVTSGAQWKLVGNSVMVAPFQLPPLSPELLGPLAELLGLPSEGLSINPDQWDGYAADRRRLLATLAGNGVRDTVFLTGDIHSSWASDVPRDAGLYPLSPSVATEFVCTSVTSDNIDEILGVPPRTVSPALETADPGAEPAHQVRRAGLARRVGAGGDPGRGADGLVLPGEQGGPGEHADLGHGRSAPVPAPSGCSRWAPRSGIDLVARVAVVFDDLSKTTGGGMDLGTLGVWDHSSWPAFQDAARWPSWSGSATARPGSAAPRRRTCRRWSRSLARVDVAGGRDRHRERVGRRARRSPRPATTAWPPPTRTGSCSASALATARSSATGTRSRTTSWSSYLDGLDEAGVPESGRMLAALGPKVLRLARDRTAGAHPYLTTPEHTAQAREILGAGKLLVPEQKVILSTDPAQGAGAGPPEDRLLLRPAELHEQLAASRLHRGGPRRPRQRQAHRRTGRLGRRGPRSASVSRPTSRQAQTRWRYRS